MKRHWIILIIVILLIGAYIIVRQKNNDFKSIKKQLNIEQSQELKQSDNSASSEPLQNNSEGNRQKEFQQPLDKPQERISKKYFGILITPRTSPVQPERFYGYHTGVDFETFPEEQNVDVAVHAVCSGKLLVKRYASGYGGIAVQTCNLNNQPITVVYGHMKLSNIRGQVGDNIDIGSIIGVLGKGYSSETDGERKHLHLGFHKGSAINILGYVQNKHQLFNWIDPCQYVCDK